MSAWVTPFSTPSVVTSVLSIIVPSVLSLLLICTGAKFEVGLGNRWLTWTQPSYVHSYNLWWYVALYDCYCLLTVLKRHACSMSKPGVCRIFPTPCPVSVRMSWAKGMYQTCLFKAWWCRSSMGNVWFETLPWSSASEGLTFMSVLRKCYHSAFKWLFRYMLCSFLQ